MLLRIGELANQTGLTVRTLHHYDDIGLLKPSKRSEAGYRLYRRQDIARLYHIQALRTLGMSLTEIGTLLDQPSPPLTTVIEEQIHLLDRQIAQKTHLRDRLMNLHHQFTSGTEPEAGDWLKTLELMTMYDRYFTPEELDRLPLFQATPAHQTEWQALVQEAEALLRHNAPPSSVFAQDLAIRWMAKLERDTAGDPTLLDKLNTMHSSEPDAQEQLGIAKRVSDYVMQAFAESKLSIYREYLTTEEFEVMREHYPQCMHEWPSLLSQLKQLMEEGTQPHETNAQAVAKEWLALLQRFAGNDPATHNKIRQANEHEPALKAGTWMNEDMKDYLGRSVAHLTGS